VEVPLNPEVWHLAQTTVVWAPVKGKLVVEWLKMLSSQLFWVWQMVQSAG
jgi:hypothetical protein